MPTEKTQLRDIDVLRARAVAGALFAARPTDYQTNDVARGAWYDAVRHLGCVVCSADGISLTAFYDLCGVPD